MKNSQESKDVRQNDTYKKSRKHEANLRRNPTLHFQIGLILALLVSILFIELRMPTKAIKDTSTDLTIEDPEWAADIEIERVKVEKITKPQVQPKAQIPEEFEVIDDNDTDIVQDLIDFDEYDVDDDISTNLLETTKEVDIVDPPVVVDFIKIEQVPLFPGCEGLSTNDERKACMSSKISKFVSRKFKTEIGEELGLEGLNRIFVQFTIDATGNVTNIKTRGPREELELEASRVIKLLPEMTPGKQRGVPVGVIYNLPIAFRIQD